jgi:DNA polymerase-3 subunit beta
MPLHITLEAGQLASALAMNALVLDPKNKVEVLDAVRITAADNTITLTTNTMHRALTTTAAAHVQTTGETAVRGEAVATLTAGFPPDATVTLAGSEDGLRVSCGRSHFKLPVMPLTHLPKLPVIDTETGHAELDRAVLQRLLMTPLSCVNDDKSRIYLTGVCLHNVDGELVAVGTNGQRLARIGTPVTGVLAAADDRSLIVPRDTVKVLGKLLGRIDTEYVALRRSRTLLEIEMANVRLISKLVDHVFPQYVNIVPRPNPDNHCTVDRAALRAALSRVAALVEKTMHDTVGLEWANDSELHLILPRQPGAVDDTVTAETAARGICRTALAISMLAGILEELDGERVRLELKDARSPVRITDPDDPQLLFLQMPLIGFEQPSAEEAAA